LKIKFNFDIAVTLHNWINSSYHNHLHCDDYDKACSWIADKISRKYSIAELAEGNF